VGPKTADRVVLEMRDRIRMLKASLASTGADIEGDGDQGLRGDVVSALINLGYRESQAEAAVSKVLTVRPGPGGRPPGDDRLEDVLKKSLRYLAS
jgi:Holliday junction DNA helicase RuvA